MASIRYLPWASILAATCVGTGPQAKAAGPATVWPAPAAEKLSDDFSLAVSGASVPVYSCRVSAVPLNQVWPGYQRPIDQTELASFAHWGMSGPVTVEITAKRAFKGVVVRPLSRGIQPTVRGQHIAFALEKPGQVTVELDGPHHALHLFADPPETGVPQANAAKVRYFGPGVHRPGKIQLHSGETLYVAGGAVVYTAVSAHGATGVRILGRGIIDTSEYERGQGGGCIRLSDCSDVKIDGLILRDPDVWCVTALGCRNLEISNLKLVGLWRYNADGIDICNCQDVVVRNSFVRAFDDAVVLKGLDSPSQQRPLRNVRVHDMVLWCDWGRALEIGAETAAPEIANIRFQDCDIIRTTHIAMDIQCGDRALVHDVRYERIRTETDDVCPSPRMQSRRDERYVADPNDSYVPQLMVIVIAKNPYSRDAERGNVRNVAFVDLSVTGRRAPRSYFSGLDAQHSVQHVAIHNLRFNGKVAASAAEAGLSIGQHVNDVRVDPNAPAADAQTAAGPRLGKIKAGRILFLGNSITACPPNWWGLSASTADKDYAHLLAAAISAKSGARLTMIPTTAPTTNPDGSVDVGPSNVINIADVFERGYASYQAAKLSKQIAWKADLVVLQFGENIPMASFNAEVFKTRLKTLMADLKASGNPHIFMPSYILGANPAVDAIKRSICGEDPTHRVFVDLSSVGKDPANMGAYGHPGDRGMRRIAEILFKAVLEHATATSSAPPSTGRGGAP